MKRKMNWVARQNFEQTETIGNCWKRGIMHSRGQVISPTKDEEQVSRNGGS